MRPIFGILSVALLATGCATSPDTQQIQNELDQVKKQNVQLQAKVDQSTANLEKTNSQNSQTTNSASSGGLLPPNAKIGECYARVLTPATYRTDTKDVIKSEAGYRIEVSHPTYQWTTQDILVKEASEVAELIPAVYEWKTEAVLVKEAHDHLKTIPAVYETKSEEILVKQAFTTWKKGRGPIEKLNNSTGEIMCLVETPAQYKTITSRVLVTAARVEKESHDAEYKEVRKRVMVEGPKMVKRTIPAVYKTIKVKKIATPAQESRIEIPAVYQTLSTRVKLSDSILEWRSILCETNTTGTVVRDIQRALSISGHNPGRIDGVIGRDTMVAIKSYQRAKGLAVGQLTFETLKSLGVTH